ncbi:DUF2306 domain-containing protein [Paracidobacterium acidisoli]|uniref:DUF2306 domain-containing protein n=1 Tax=Paracidobacterium acidisoli TaxID=2303751 RepID=A0A372IPV3_9BACT|nr:DUF2306 domain-containing protein [Paracidobacterium acidisoli]MBT9331230.1 DUF2306 domain-containing protein [Paracidobacterium acidisoli]
MTRTSESAWSAPEALRAPGAWVWTLFFLLCLIAVGAAARRIAVLLLPSAQPSVSQTAALDATFAAHKMLTLAHIVPALLFVLLLPAWFSRTVRGRVNLHRNITYGLLILGPIVGVTAALLSLHPVGGLNEATAALLYDALFLFSLGRAWLMLRRGDWTLHRRWMVRAVAVLLGIATTRPVMGAFFATRSVTHLTLHQFFGTAFWIGFTITYIAGESYLRAYPDAPAAAEMAPAAAGSEA